MEAEKRFARPGPRGAAGRRWLAGRQTPAVNARALLPDLPAPRNGWVDPFPANLDAACVQRYIAFWPEFENTNSVQ